MKKTFPILPALVLLAGACSKNSGGGGVKFRNDTDSVAYVIGMNVGANLLKMDSTINVNAVCEGIRDMFRGNPRLSAADAETFYLSYVNYALPEKARAYEEQFLLDIAKSNRSYARTSSGVTYTVTDVGDQNQVPTSERDSVALRWVIRTAAGDEITSSYERGDTVRSLVRNLRRGVQESVKLIGKAARSTQGCLRRQPTAPRATRNWAWLPMRRSISRSNSSTSTSIRPGRGGVDGPSGAAGSAAGSSGRGDFAKIVARNHFVNKIFISLRGISPRFDRRRLGRAG